ncbi:hypothetical protein QFC21_005584 [Naganishia friedmannii]|uniref:Uncharacterized protein n=1 Tax=Naganishia friedmannii TaxID=89922 RepID=A0ACC2V9Q1_9TREE|nr:hypothetical protein QFC21_005584 [Naganishia friedmannii]
MYDPYDSEDEVDGLLSPQPVQHDRPRSRSPSPRPASESANGQVEEERQCRICFGGTDEEADCGRLISPCLCSGSMRHVHVGCLQQWRGTGRNRKAFMECSACGFRYRLRRTRILGLASSTPIRIITSVALFITLALAVGSVLHWLLRFRGLRRIVVGPYGDTLGFDPQPNPPASDLLSRLAVGHDIPWEEAFRHDPIGAGVRVGLPGGLVYVSTGSGVFELIVKSIRAFVNGEAAGVVAACVGFVASCWDWITRTAVFVAVYRYFIHPLHIDTLAFALLSVPAHTGGLLRPLLARFTLGLSLIGSASFVTLLITHSVMPFFHVANNLRLGRGAGPFGLPVRTHRGRMPVNGGGGGGIAAAGLGSAVLVLFVVMGAVRAIHQLYALTNYYSFILLSKAENAMLEVNPKGEVIPDQPGGLGAGIITTDGSRAVIAAR